ncbi:MAG: hypothetical protein Q8P11_01565 [bacterium]|nr:hypothetical protein [bacterium]
MAFSSVFTSFLSTRVREEEITASEEGSVTVNDAVSAIAFYYEKIRGIVEYRDEHLVRQHAIRRVLGRRFILTQPTEQMAMGLVKELVRSRYFRNQTIPVTTVHKIKEVLDQYLGVLDQLRMRHILTDKDQDWVLFMAACAIDEVLAPTQELESLVHAMNQMVDPTTNILGATVDEKTRRVQLYISVYRILLKPDVHRLEYFLLKKLAPHWAKPGSMPVDQMAAECYDLRKKIRTHIRHPLQKKFMGTYRRFRIPFVVLVTVLRSNGEAIFADKEALEKEIRRICDGFYNVYKRKLHVRTIRAFVYIFITKITMGLIIELPYDLLHAGFIMWGPLFINVLFPPALLAVITLSAKFPNKDNTDSIVQAVNEIVYEDEPRKIFVPQKIGEKKKKVVLWVIFSLLYLALFFLSFALLAKILHSLHFNGASGVVFFLFFCLITFFGVTLRRSVTELYLLKPKASLWVAFIDPFLLPIVQVGRWLSFNVSRVNVFVFIFDIMIELPLQALIEITEEWWSFMREKKEDLE